MPPMDHRITVEVFNKFGDAFASTCALRQRGCDEARSGRPWQIGGEHELEAARGSRRQPGLGFAREVCRVIVENDLDRGRGGVGGIEQAEEFDEFAAAMAILHQDVHLARQRIDARHRRGGRRDGHRTTCGGPSPAASFVDSAGLEQSVEVGVAIGMHTGERLEVSPLVEDISF